MSKLELNKIPFLSAFINILNYDDVKNELTYTTAKNTLKYKPVFSNLDKNIIDTISFKNLCDLNKKEKLNTNDNCVTFDNCDISKYQFCFDNNQGALCQPDLIYGIKFFFNFLDPNNSTPNCYDKCSNGFTRPPTTTTHPFCTMRCDSNFRSCDNLTSLSLKNIDQNLQCTNSFIKFGNKCIPKTVADKCKIFFIFL